MRFTWHMTINANDKEQTKENIVINIPLLKRNVFKDKGQFW